MADHITAAVRKAFNQVLTDAAIEVDLSGMPTPVTMLEQPPSGLALDDEELPAIFVFTTGEEIEPETYGSDKRDITVLVYMLGKGSAGVLDQIESMQLQVEVALGTSGLLGGLVRKLRPVRMSALQEQGRYTFSARQVEYLCTTATPRNNPSI